MEVYKDLRLIYDDDDDIDASRIKTSPNALIQNTKMPKKSLLLDFTTDYNLINSKASIYTCYR